MERRNNELRPYTEGSRRNIVTVNLQERIMLTETSYVMDKETFKELQNVSEDFDESLTKETGNSNSGSPGILNNYNSDADDSNSSEGVSLNRVGFWVAWVAWVLWVCGFITWVCEFLCGFKN